MSAYNINLLPKGNQRVSDRLIYFGLHYFRYIIVITQIVVISVFLFRLREDQKVIDEKEKFKQNQQILELTIPLIDEAQAVEKKTGIIQTLLSNQDRNAQKLSSIVGLVPSEIILTSVEVNDDITLIKGSSVTVNIIKTFNEKLKTNPAFENSEIRTVDRITEGDYEFAIIVESVERK